MKMMVHNVHKEDNCGNFLQRGYSMIHGTRDKEDNDDQGN